MQLVLVLVLLLIIKMDIWPPMAIRISVAHGQKVPLCHLLRAMKPLATLFSLIMFTCESFFFKQDLII